MLASAGTRQPGGLLEQPYGDERREDSIVNAELQKHALYMRLHRSEPDSQ